jgi:hypothetical protein
MSESINEATPPERGNSERRVALTSALIGAIAGLVGAVVGTAGSVYVQHASAAQTIQVNDSQAMQDACSAFIGSASRADLLLNSIFIISSYDPAQAKSVYIDALNQVEDNSFPDLYGKQAAVQLITTKQNVSDLSTNWVNQLVDEFNYFQEKIGMSGSVVQHGIITVSEYRSLDDPITKTRNEFIDDCSAEVRFSG